MASRRMIDPSFWQSETIARLPLSARYLFIGLFSNADDQGRMKANPALIRSKVYPLDDIALDAIAADLDLLEAGEFIKRYEVDGSRYLQVVNWWKHQHPTWAWPSDLPPPDGWTDQACYRRGNAVVKSNWPGDEPEPEVAPVKSDPTVSPPRPHNEVTVGLPPSGSGSISTSTSTSDSGSDRQAQAVEQAPATAVAVDAPADERAPKAVVVALSRLGISESTIRAKMPGWPHPEHAAELVRLAERTPGIHSRSGFVLSKLAEGWMPPIETYDPPDLDAPLESDPDPPDIGDAVPFWPEMLLTRLDPSTFNHHFRDSRARFDDGKIIVTVPAMSLMMVEKRLRPVIEEALAEHGKALLLEGA